MKVGDLIEFRHGSIGVPLGSHGLVLTKIIQKTMEPGRLNYFVYDIQTLDGRVRRFTDKYLKKVS
jgi:hypothetical protein